MLCRVRQSIINVLSRILLAHEAAFVSVLGQVAIPAASISAFAQRLRVYVLVFFCCCGAIVMFGSFSFSFPLVSSRSD